MGREEMWQTEERERDECGTQCRAENANFHEREIENRDGWATHQMPAEHSPSACLPHDGNQPAATLYVYVPNQNRRIGAALERENGAQVRREEEDSRLWRLRSPVTARAACRTALLQKRLPSSWVNTVLPQAFRHARRFKPFQPCVHPHRPPSAAVSPNVIQKKNVL
jgi:hypothetical protein